MSLLDIFKFRRKKTSNTEKMKPLDSITPTVNEAKEEPKPLTEKEQRVYAKRIFLNLYSSYNFKRMTGENFEALREAYHTHQKYKLHSELSYISERSTPSDYGPGDPISYRDSYVTTYVKDFTEKGNTLYFRDSSGGYISNIFSRDDSHDYSYSSFTYMITEHNNKLFVMHECNYREKILIEGTFYNIDWHYKGDQLEFESDYPNLDELQAALQNFFPNRTVVNKNVASTGSR